MNELYCDRCRKVTLFFYSPLRDYEDATHHHTTCQECLNFSYHVDDIPYIRLGLRDYLDVLRNPQEYENDTCKFGKHKNNTLKQVTTRDKGYVSWVHRNLDSRSKRGFKKLFMYALSFKEKNQRKIITSMLLLKKY